MEKIDFPFSVEMDWTRPTIPPAHGLKRFSESRVCARVVLGEARMGNYDCFDPRTKLSGYYGRFGLSLAEGNYIQMAAAIAGGTPFENGTPMVAFDQLPAALRAHFAAGGRLFWTQTYGVTVARQWHRLHVEYHLRPGETAVRRKVSQTEGVALTATEIAGRIVTWETLRSEADLPETRPGKHLLDLRELGEEITATLALAERNATDGAPGRPGVLRWRNARSQSFVRAFSAPRLGQGAGRRDLQPDAGDRGVPPDLVHQRHAL